MSEIRPQDSSLPGRIIRFPLTLLIIELVVVVIAASLASAAMAIARTSAFVPLRTLGALVVAAVTIGAYLACRRWIERRPGLGEFGGAGAGRELGAGLAFGFVLFSLTTGVVALLGGLTITGWHFPGALWAMLAMGVVSSVTEEVLFRGIAFRHIEAMLGSWAALAITSAFFGLAHLSNPNASWFAAIAIALEAGIMLGGAYMLTRRLWMAIGIHAAWNFTQGWVFSIPVSGGKVPEGLFGTSRSGAEWLTGGDFGLEASAVAMVLATGAGIALVLACIRKGRLMAPMWKRRPEVSNVFD